MPELPEVENVRLSLDKKVTGRTIEKVVIHDDRVVKYNENEDFIARLEGRRLDVVDRRGKFLILESHGYFGVSEPERFIVHLGMTGALLHSNGDYSNYPATITNHVLVEMTLDDGSMLMYSDYRRFGSLRVVTEHDFFYSLETHLKTLQSMGSEPFAIDAEEQFMQRIRLPRYAYKPIKDVLLDQRVLAGAGNIYANECLFPIGVNPFTEVEDLTDAELKDIFEHLVALLKLSIEMGGSSIRDYVDGEGKSGSFQTVLKVYDQNICQVCSSPIYKDFINKRATYYCPVCQA